MKGFKLWIGIMISGIALWFFSVTSCNTTPSNGNTSSSAPATSSIASSLSSDSSSSSNSSSSSDSSLSSDSSSSSSSSSSSTASFSTNGLIGRWEFSGNYSDTSGINGDINHTSPVTISNSDFLVFNDTNVYSAYNISKTIVSANTNEVTIALNFYTLTNALSKTSAFTGSSGYRWINIRVSTNNYLIVALHNSSYTYILSNTIATANTWHSVVVTMIATNRNMKIWFDGTQVTNMTYGVNAGIFESDYGIQVYNGGMGYQFVGYLDNWILYNRAVSDAEVPGILSVMK